jgi:putative ABC transport system permease protein
VHNSPENPDQVTISQPSSALTARADAKDALDTLLLGLGADALLVGAIGVANIMVISRQTPRRHTRYEKGLKTS